MEPPDSNKLHAAALPNAAVPAILQQISERANAALHAALQQLLVNCDDIYFALAEQATSNNEQSMFFESMRAVRLRKDSIIARFQSELDASFQALTGAPTMQIAAAEARGEETLSLLQNVELEKSVALSSMVATVRSAASEQLYSLSTRLDFLLEQTSVDINNNPFDPAQLCSAFAAATEIADLDGKARMVLLKQFERMLASELPTLCADANQQLIDAGVLPSISRAVKTAQSRRSVATDTATATVADFSQISLLLNNLRQQALRTEKQTIPMLLSSSGGGQPIAEQELLALLSNLQAQVGESAATAVDIRELLKKVLDQRSSQGEPGSLRTPDEDIINLVAMFFDFVLEDRQLPAHAQALIGRLQFPVLKIALQDKTFFNNSSHPARRLINEIVSIGMAMNDSEAAMTDAVYQRLTTIIRVVNDQQQPGDVIFARALTEIQQVRSAETARATKIEKRTCASVQAEATTKQAQVTVRNTLFERLQDVSVPELIQKFLVDDWQQVMFLVQLKYGERSPEEVEVKQTMDDLIWSSLHHVDAKSQQRLQRLLPELQQRLRKWLAQTLASNDRVEQALQPLLVLHSRLVEPQASAAVARRTLPENQSEALHPSAEQQKSWGEMTALERQHVEHQDLAYSFIKQAEEYPLGTWFSINNAADGKLLRCKLAVKVAASDSYIFVNRLGFQVLAMKRKDFAYELQQERGQALQTEQFFERTLAKVVGQLQQLAGTLTQAAQQPQT